MLRVAGIFALVLFVYWPSVHGQFLWDDPAHVTRPDLRSLDGLRRIWFEFGATQEYYPVLHGAFWIQHRLWGDAVEPYHVANILLHALNACLLAFILRRLWCRPPAGKGDAGCGEARSVPPGAEWFAAALLAVHPVCVESVAWITEQKNTLSTAFYLLAGLGYLAFLRKRTACSYVIALTLFVLALGAKTMTVTLPAALLVVLWWKHGRLRWRRDVLPLVPWFALAIAAGLLTAWFESTWVGAQGAGHDLPLGQRALLAARIFWFSLSQLLWPVNLTFFYERWDVARESGGWIVHALGFIFATLALWVYRGRSRGPLAVWLLYAGTLFPVLGFFNVFGFSFAYVADHFQYLAIPVAMAGIAAAGALGLRRTGKVPAWTGRALAAALVALLGFRAHQQSRLYRDNETLFRANIAANPQSWMGHHILAHTLAQSPGRRDESIALYRKALQLKSGNADSHHKLGLMLAEDPASRDEAIEHYRAALRLRPDFPEAHHSLAVALMDLPGGLPEAIEHYRKALELRPRFAHAHANLAVALARMPGREAEALRHFEEALRRLPDYAPAHYHLANLLASLPDRTAEAIPHYRAVLAQHPDAPEAHLYLANALAQNGQPSEAIAHYEQALRLRPDWGEAHAFFAHTLSRLPNRRSEALTHYETALRLDPDLAWAHYHFAAALADDPGRSAEATRHTEDALRLRPDFVEAHNLLGVLRARAGQFAAAKASWERALQIDPRFELARRNLRELEQAGGR